MLRLRITLWERYSTYIQLIREGFAISKYGVHITYTRPGSVARRVKFHKLMSIDAQRLALRRRVIKDSRNYINAFKDYTSYIGLDISDKNCDILFDNWKERQTERCFNRRIEHCKYIE